MKSIIMLSSEHEMGAQLRNSLSTHYQIIQSEAPPQLTEMIDLCIVDVPGLGHLYDWLRAKKATEVPVDFPVLLTAASEDINLISAEYRHLPDGLMLAPFEAEELLAQVRTLLRARRLTQQLQRQSERLTSISKAIESTSDAISISNVSGNAIYLNQAFTDIYGFRVNELNIRGIPNSLFTDPAMAHDIITAIQENRSWSGEVELKTKQGKIVPTLLRADSIEDDTGRRIGLISVHTDITERKRAEAVQRKHHAFEKALRDSSTVLTSTLKLDKVMDRILINIGSVVAHNMAYVMLVENGDARVVRLKGFGNAQTQANLASQRFRISDYTNLQKMVDTGEAIIGSDEDAAWDHSYPFLQNNVRSFIGIPIHLKGKVRGFLYLFSEKPDYFTAEHADRLQAFSEHAAIAIQNAQLHEKAQQLAMYQERQRLAHKLHDAVSQTLYSASVIAEALPHLIERNSDQVKGRLAQLHRLTRGAMAEMRTLLLELRPSVLTEANFDELLTQLTEALRGRTHLDVVLNVDGSYRLPEKAQIALFYIAQEALNNVVKHAKATRVAVQLTHTDDQLQLNILDNGQGFEPTQTESTSMGLGIMRERATGIGAQLRITSRLEQGTQVQVTWTNSQRKEYQ